jgi:predicted GTPase
LRTESSHFTKLLIGCVYIPPENRKYTSDRVFNEIKNELMSFSQNTKHIALVGDFNSRTSNLTDYILPDEELINEILDIVDDDVIESMFSHQILQHHDVPLDRCSEDRGRPNTYDSAMCHFLKIYRYL